VRKNENVGCLQGGHGSADEAKGKQQSRRQAVFTATRENAVLSENQREAGESEKEHSSIP